MTRAIPFKIRVEFINDVAQKMAKHNFKPMDEPAPDRTIAEIEEKLIGFSPSDISWILHNTAISTSPTEIVANKALAIALDNLDKYLEKQAIYCEKLQDMDWDISDQEREKRNKIIASIEERLLLFELVRTNILRMVMAQELAIKKVWEEKEALKTELEMYKTEDRNRWIEHQRRIAIDNWFVKNTK